jgi:hypothetical protein
MDGSTMRPDHAFHARRWFPRVAFLMLLSARRATSAIKFSTSEFYDGNN